MCFETTLESFQKRESYGALAPKPTPKNTWNKSFERILCSSPSKLETPSINNEFGKSVEKLQWWEIAFPMKDILCPVPDEGWAPVIQPGEKRKLAEKERLKRVIKPVYH